MTQARPQQDATSRLRLIGCLALVVAPHVLRIPLWASLFAAVLLVWQALAALRGWGPPGRLLRGALTAIAFVGVYVDFGRVNGQQAGVALLVLMLALKLTETRRHRDVMVLLGLCYFVLVTHFLFSQSLAMAAFLLVAAWLITACFLDASHPQSALGTRTALRGAAALLLQAAPVAALLFVLFPRIPGPLWGLPGDAGASGRTGLSEHMAPGSISALATSDAVAFRVHFDGKPPPPAQRYWRGPVFWHFDGRGWDPGNVDKRFSAPRVARKDGAALQYRITVEPNHHDYLLALDMPLSTPGKSHRDAAGSVRSAKDINDRRRYAMTSVPAYHLQPQAPAALLAAARQLPAAGNPKARALAQHWRQQGLSPSQIVKAALVRFTSQNYVYTLQPPPAPGRDGIDHFLFDTRRGFCEHYAGAFTFLMRAAGIPARVVTGYQGGEHSEFGNYWIVRSSDAHAWSEVFLGGRGWVRVDPTAAVSPARIERGVSAALGANALLPYMARRNSGIYYQLQMSWDWVNTSWNRYFLAYGPELQSRFLANLGLPDIRAMLLALTGLLTAFLALLGILLLRQARSAQPADPAQRAWLAFCQQLARSGFTRAPQEGPQTFARRVASARPQWRDAVRRIAALYISLRYAEHPDPNAQRRLEAAVRGFSRRRKKPGAAPETGRI